MIRRWCRIGHEESDRLKRIGFNGHEVYIKDRGPYGPYRDEIGSMVIGGQANHERIRTAHMNLAAAWTTTLPRAHHEEVSCAT